MKNYILLFVFAGIVTAFNAFGQDEEQKPEEEGYVFTIEKELDATSVKNQYRSSTCWSFSAISFLESELLRMGKGEYNLSEMFVIRHAYGDKAKKYVRLHGSLNLAGGGAFHDVITIMNKYGMVPEEVYDGKVLGEENHIHGEMDNVVKAYVKAVVENKNKKLTPVWYQGLNGILDAYLGEIPEEFEYNGNKYTPVSFTESLGLNLDDYVELSSFTHHPFYEEFVLEVPDNWEWGLVYNIPMNEFAEVLDYAIDNGYTIAWGADVSEKGFSWKNGIAIVPEVAMLDMTDTEKEKWDELTTKEKQAALYKFDKPGREKIITQEMHQEAFDNYSMTDDHGLHITGKAKDQIGNEYFIVKNSWGDGGKYDGYFYASKSFVLMNTLDIMVHKDAIPKHIKKKLGFE